MNSIAKTLLNVMRIEVLLGIGLALWVTSMEAFASLPASRLHKDYQGIWLVEDTSRREQFVLSLRGGNYTQTMFTLAGRYVGNEVRGQSLKIRSTKERNLLLTSRLGEKVMTGKLISSTEMAGVFSDGSTWTATKTNNPKQRIVWQLVKKNRRQCGNFFKRALEPSCEETGGVGTQGAEYVTWNFPTTFKTEGLCQAYAKIYWSTVCPDKEKTPKEETL